MISAQNIKRPITDVMKTCGSYRHMQYNQIKKLRLHEVYCHNAWQKSVDFTFTDIPYNMVNHASNGLRSLDKGKANIPDFWTGCFFIADIAGYRQLPCSFSAQKEQFSQIYSLLSAQNGNTVRAIVWEKQSISNEWPARLFERRWACRLVQVQGGRKTFNAHCKNTVFRYPNGRSKEHPARKRTTNYWKILYLITLMLAILFWPLHGERESSACGRKHLNRRFLGCEINEHYFALAKKRLAG